MSTFFDPVIFREYDVRGVYKDHFNEDFAEILGFSFGQWIVENSKEKNPWVNLGHDARLSSPSLKSAVSQGLRKAGCQVEFLGLITSPLLYFSTFTRPLSRGGIMITGSHNPPEYNGFKLSLGQSTIFGEDIQKLKKRVESNLQKGLPSSAIGAETSFDIFPSYIERYAKEFKGLSQIKVVLDCGNGAAGVVARKLFENCGVQTSVLFEQPDGRFPNHHPDPTVEKNMKHLQEAVLKEGAHLGIGFDGDADRIGVIDHRGRMLFGDELMVVLSTLVMQDNPGCKIIGDVKCSDRLFQYIKERGASPIVWKTGHSLIKEKIKVEKAPFGGEMSGHVFFADRNYGTDDALYAGLRTCEVLSRTQKTLPDILSTLPKSFTTPEIRIDTTEEKKILAVKALKSMVTHGQFNKDPDTRVNELDGVRVSFQGSVNGWALVRSSNTQPVLVVRYESTTESGLANIRSKIEGVINPILNS